MPRKNGVQLRDDVSLTPTAVSGMMPPPTYTGFTPLVITAPLVSTYTGAPGTPKLIGVAVFANGSRNYAKTDNPGVIRQQVAKAPEWTAAGGILYKHGPIRFSLIDKWVGKQFFIAPGGSIAPGNAYDNPVYQSRGYNSAILSARYDIGPVRIGVEVNNLLDSKRVTSISAGKTSPFDQYFYQVGRAFTGDITVTF